jgi:hypothetical protein
MEDTRSLENSALAAAIDARTSARSVSIWALIVPISARSVAISPRQPQATSPTTMLPNSEITAAAFDVVSNSADGSAVASVDGNGPSLKEPEGPPREAARPPS